MTIVTRFIDLGDVVCRLRIHPGRTIGCAYHKEGLKPEGECSGCDTSRQVAKGTVYMALMSEAEASEGAFYPAQSLRISPVAIKTLRDALIDIEELT